MTDFDTRLASFIEGAAEIANRGRDATPLGAVTLTPEAGRRYVRVVRTEERGPARSVHCFVDTKTGDVLKADGWKAPAKHARGNIFNPDNGLGLMGPYGPAYLRR